MTEWSEDALAKWVSWLPPSDSGDRLPMLIGLIQADLVMRWRNGQQPTILSYLHQFPELGPPDQLPDSFIRLEWNLRQEVAHPSDLTEFAQRYARPVEDLRQILGQPSGENTGNLVPVVNHADPSELPTRILLTCSPAPPLLNSKDRVAHDDTDEGKLTRLVDARTSDASAPLLAVPTNSRTPLSFRICLLGMLAIACLGWGIVWLRTGPLDKGTDMVRTQLTSSQLIEKGDVSDFTSEQWLERWERLRSKSAGSTPPQTAEALARCAGHREKARHLVATGRSQEALVLWRQASDELNHFEKDVTRRQITRTEILREAQTLLEGRLTEKPTETETADALANVLLETRKLPEWTVLEVTAINSAAGATLTCLPDGSILASGINPLTDTYTIEVKNTLKGTSALQLEVLPDQSLPERGPGRYPGQPGWPSGNFHLTEISLAPVPNDAPTGSIPMTYAAGYQRADAGTLDGPHGAIDGTHATRWDIQNNQGRVSSARFQLKTPVVEAKMIIRLDFQDPYWKQHSLGRFRLSVTSVANPVRDENLIAMTRTATPWARLGIAYLLRDDREAARAAFEKATATTRTTTDRLLLAFTRELLGQQITSEDLELPAKTLSQMPATRTSRFLTEVTSEMLSRSITREPKPSLFLIRSQLLTRLGRVVEGNAELARSLELDPKRPLGRMDASAHLWAAEFWRLSLRPDRAALHTLVACLLNPEMTRTPLPGHAFLVGPGRWKAEGKELVQEAQVNAACWLRFGDPVWTDYDLELEAMRFEGGNGFGIGFRMANDSNFANAEFGGWGNKFHGLEVTVNGKEKILMSRESAVLPNQWYRVKLEVRGPRVRVFLDGKQILETATFPILRGKVGVRSWGTANRFRNIKITTPDGMSLFEGLPYIHRPPAGEAWPDLP